MSRDELEAIQPEPPSELDDAPQQETERDVATADALKKKAEAESALQDVQLRKSYAKGIFGAAFAWLAFSAVTVVLAGCEVLKLPESAIGLLIGSATADLLGMLTIIVRNLFPRRDG